MDLSKLNTELRNVNTMDLDQLDSIGIVRKINQEDQAVAPMIQQHLTQIASVVDYIYPAFQTGRLFYCGAGTSGRLAVIDAAECPPTFGASPDKIIGLIAGGKEALLVAQEGAEDDLNGCRKQLDAYQFNAQDCLVGVAASGRTPYVVGGLTYARSIGAKTVAISNVEHAVISDYADIALEVVTGPEVITGSTRMKAGTAQKLVLNMISTTLMIKMGKIYTNLMVDVQPTNAKLVKRAVQIIAESIQISTEEAAILFEDAKRDVKVAITMGLLGVSKEQAKAMLDLHNQRIADLIHAHKK